MNQNVKEIFTHLGNIFFRMSIVMILIMISMMASQLLWLTTILVLITIDILVVVGTLGVAFFNPELKSFLAKTVDIISGTGFSEFMLKVLNSFPIITIITASVITLSLICFAFNLKNNILKFCLLIVGSILFIITAIIISIVVIGGK